MTLKVEFIIPVDVVITHKFISPKLMGESVCSKLYLPCSGALVMGFQIGIIT